MIIERTQRIHAALRPTVPAELPTADIADAWWQRWSLGPLPMMRATVRPETRVNAVNQALVSRLGFTVQDTPSIVRSVLTALQSYTEATGESTRKIPDPRVMTFELECQDGTALSLCMFFVAHEGRLPGEISVVGVGLPPSTDSVQHRMVPILSQETVS